ncbi:hypothetical protein [Ralstonia phage phiRSL1]|uniref:Uncharacterized protein n=1 Tax=Ralstonia phage phiRSL1 TaxID=1980924 RepID=B2ZXU5_9CAUD|nr:hypothetical protein RSL1_ORF075 [Ralstonia phage phiRSL1]BAG41521.1 hypothetical protein [Ralstonia phage phiRSL1]
MEKLKVNGLSPLQTLVAIGAGLGVNILAPLQNLPSKFKERPARKQTAEDRKRLEAAAAKRERKARKLMGPRNDQTK